MLLGFQMKHEVTIQDNIQYIHRPIYKTKDKNSKEKEDLNGRLESKIKII